MDHDFGAFANARNAAIDVIIVSQVCLFRECIARCLADDFTIHVLDACASRDQALQSLERLHPDMVLLDARFAGGTEFARAGGEAQIVVIAMEETEANILAWGDIGVTDYIADTATMRDLPRLVRQIRYRRRSASPVNGTPRLFGVLAGKREPPAELALTPRERVIQRHIGAGLSNKDIARALDISVGTTKAHVHNILGKLSLTSRVQIAAQLGNARAPIE